VDLLTAARSTGAVRQFTADPVPDETVHRVLDTARFAPSGGNRQGWKVVVVRSAETKRALAAHSQPTWNAYRAMAAAGENPFNTVVPTAVDVEAAERVHAENPLLEHIDDVPVVLVVGLDLSVTASVDAGLGRVGVVSGASVYPFVWNLLLAARAEGLGGVLTTFVARAEPAVQALVGFPSHVAVAAMVPLGVPVHQPTKLRRNPVESFATLERFDGEPLRSSPAS
jgi:nitroreductase